MPDFPTPADLTRVRRTRGWSQQYVANLSKVNKAYISEYESGIRPELPPEMMARLRELLTAGPPGHTAASIEFHEGRRRLVLKDAQGNVFYPRTASVHWTEDDGTEYSMFLGDAD